MAIAPIDLQTLFTQLDKVGKAHTSQKEGQINQAIEAMQIQKKTDEQMLQINEAQNTGEGAEKVKDRPNENHRQSGNKNKRNKDGAEEEKENTFVLSDPSLGKNIDITL